MIRAQFRVNTRQVAGNLRSKVIAVQKKIAFQFLESIVNMTPVDTGRARANWQVTIGAPAKAMAWEKKDKSGGTTIASGAAIISSLDTLGAIYLTNNLPYILALEQGHSQRQAPQGMVQVTVDRVMSQFGRS